MGGAVVGADARAPLMIDEMRRLGCDVDTAPWSHRKERETLLGKILSRSRDVWLIRRRLRRQRFDLMLVTTTHDWLALLRDIPLLALTRGYCRARVLHLHGSMSGSLVGPGHYLLKSCSRWLTRRCDAILVLSQEERDQWLRFNPKVRCEVVINPFVPPAPTQRRSWDGAGGRPVLLFVGRLIPEKGIFDLLDAINALSHTCDCFLRVAGLGSHEQAIRERVHELGLSESVELLGYVEEDTLARLYASSDVFVLPTYFGEGFPTVIAEAMSYGLPIVTTPVRGAADLLSEGEHVLFVPPRRPRELADALRRLLENPAMRAEMGERNREAVKAFAPSLVVPRYVDIMRSLVGSETSAARPNDEPEEGC
jgi:glycosyltransferase involved in cell wall biosynthesis